MDSETCRRLRFAPLWFSFGTVAGLIMLCVPLQPFLSHSHVLVEYDKLIDRQLERAAITSISGFGKICDGAAAVLNV